MKPLVKALSLVLFSLPLLAHAGSKSATMQVSFTVTDSCTVQAGSTAAPAVACQLNAPHLVIRDAAQPAAAAVTTANTPAATTPAPASAVKNATVQPAAKGQDWTIYF